MRHLAGMTPVLAFIFHDPVHPLPIHTLSPLGSHRINFPLRFRVVARYIAAEHRVAATRWPTLAVASTRGALPEPLAISLFSRAGLARVMSNVSVVCVSRQSRGCVYTGAAPPVAVVLSCDGLPCRHRSGHAGRGLIGRRTASRALRFIILTRRASRHGGSVFGKSLGLPR